MPDDQLGNLIREVRGEIGDHDRGRARLADALRHLVAASVAPDLDDADADDLAARLEELGTRFESPVSRQVPGARLASGAPDIRFVTHPLVGAGNAFAPPLRYEQTETGALARATYGAPYEGLPGAVHGGVIASAFDGVLIFAAVTGGHPSVTGSLAVSFRRVAPLNTEIVYEGSVARVDGRKATVTGTLRDPQGELCAEAEGVFVSVDRERFAT